MVPKTAPDIFPIPPEKEIPPTTHAAIASSSVPDPVLGEPEPTLAPSKNPPIPYRTPAITNIPIVTLKTLIPDTDAASVFPPTAYIYLPNLVLFQINQTITIAIIA
ncbi:unknown [Firmicutes bacterium CAG:449]|nr:unknown [Firmicutes bacterium CAG:449]